MLVDVTQEREVERRLEEARQLADGIIENLPGLFFMFDRWGRPIRWNKERERVQGYTAEELAALGPASEAPGDSSRASLGPRHD